MDEILAEDVRALAASLDDEAEAAALLEVFALASEAVYEPPAENTCAPFVYPH